MERKHSGAANTRTVQQAQRQTLHEGQRRGLGGAVVYGPGDGRLGQDGIYTHYMAVLQLQHPGKKSLCSLDRRENKRESGGGKWGRGRGKCENRGWNIFSGAEKRSEKKNKFNLNFHLVDNAVSVYASLLISDKIKGKKKVAVKFQELKLKI